MSPAGPTIGTEIGGATGSGGSGAGNATTATMTGNGGQRSASGDMNIARPRRRGTRRADDTTGLDGSGVLTDIQDAVNLKTTIESTDEDAVANGSVVGLRIVAATRTRADPRGRGGSVAENASTAADTEVIPPLHPDALHPATLTPRTALRSGEQLLAHHHFPGQTKTMFRTSPVRRRVRATSSHAKTNFALNSSARERAGRSGRHPRPHDVIAPSLQNAAGAVRPNRVTSLLAPTANALTPLPPPHPLPPGAHAVGRHPGSVNAPTSLRATPRHPTPPRPPLTLCTHRARPHGPGRHLPGRRPRRPRSRRRWTSTSRSRTTRAWTSRR